MQSASASYEQSLKDKKISDLGAQPANGVGFEISHMVKWTSRETTATVFNGAKPTTGESLIIGAVNPTPINVNKQTFINDLTATQLAMFAPSIQGLVQ